MSNLELTTMSEVSAQVAVELEQFIARNSQDLHIVSQDFDLIEKELQQYLAGGKRLRPLFAVAGFKYAAAPITTEVTKAVAALELIQASALIHDDLMDASDTRRGRETIHRRFQRLHIEENWDGDSVTFGAAAAILIGNLCLVWADKMLFESGLPAQNLLAAKPFFDALRVEVMAGQYLDVIEQNRRTADLAAISNIVNFKTSKYTVERPLHLGAALAGADESVISQLSQYAGPIGEAFQYRDDLLGAFGETEVTGKPVGDDFREGKRTLLVALLHERASASEWEWFETILGNPELNENEISAAQQLLEKSGIHALVEQKISELHASALKSLEFSKLSAECQSWLTDLSSAALYRSK